MTRRSWKCQYPQYVYCTCVLLFIMHLSYYTYCAFGVCWDFFLLIFFARLTFYVYNNIIRFRRIGIFDETNSVRLLIFFSYNTFRYSRQLRFVLYYFPRVFPVFFFFSPHFFIYNATRVILWLFICYTSFPGGWFFFRLIARYTGRIRLLFFFLRQPPPSSSDQYIYYQITIRYFSSLSN